MTRKQLVFDLGLSLMLGGAADIVFFGARIDTWAGPVSFACVCVGYVLIGVSFSMSR